MLENVFVEAAVMVKTINPAMWYARSEANSYGFWRFLITGMPGARRIHSGFGVFW